MFSTEYRGRIGATRSVYGVQFGEKFGEVLRLEEAVVGQSPNDRTASGNLVVDRTD
jgi:hypothetical protein